MKFMNSYEELSSDVKVYLNKAMDIYNTIRNKDIHRTVTRLFQDEEYYFNNMDKKVISLYIASFLVPGNLKDILSKYDELKIERLFSFIDIEEKDIIKLDESEYSAYYHNNFEFELNNMLSDKQIEYTFNKITSETIFLFMKSYSVNDSFILDTFRNYANLRVFNISRHLSFKEVEDYAVNNDYIKLNSIFRINDIDTLPDMSSTLNKRNLDFIFDKHPLYKDEKDLTKQSDLIDLNDDKLWSILDDIQKKFIGQELLAEQLFYNIINNQKLATSEDLLDGQRSIIFLDGPTGTGKTAIIREITKNLGIPFASSSITNYSSTGYRGGDITDTLQELLKKTNQDVEKAQRGIIVFDEFDKIASIGEKGLEMKTAVQQQLLDFMGGGKYSVGAGGFFLPSTDFDTSKLTFVCLGALSQLRTNKTQKKSSLGFTDLNESEEIEEYSITPEDLISIGLERELVGRFNTYLHTEEYPKETLLKILKESTISPLIGFENWITSNGKKLEIEEGVHEVIADAAYKLNTGARSLQTVMNNIRTHFIKDVLRGKDTIINLDVDTVISINNSTINRKVRK